MKPAQYAQDREAVIIRIKEIINEVSIEIKFTLITHSK